MVQIVASPEASFIPYQLVVIIISSIIFALISVLLWRSLKSQKQELDDTIKRKLAKGEFEFKFVSLETETKPHIVYTGYTDTGKESEDQALKNEGENAAKKMKSEAMQYDFTRLRVRDLEKIQKDLSMIEFYKDKLVPGSKEEQSK